MNGASANYPIKDGAGYRQTPWKKSVSRTRNPLVGNLPGTPSPRGAHPAQISGATAPLLKTPRGFISQSATPLPIEARDREFLRRIGPELKQSNPQNQAVWLRHTQAQGRLFHSETGQRNGMPGLFGRLSRPALLKLQTEVRAPPQREITPKPLEFRALHNTPRLRLSIISLSLWSRSSGLTAAPLQSGRDHLIRWRNVCATARQQLHEVQSRPIQTPRKPDPGSVLIPD